MNIWNALRPSNSSSHLTWSHLWSPGHSAYTWHWLVFFHPPHTWLHGLRKSAVSLSHVWKFLISGTALPSSSWPSCFTVCRDPDPSWIPCLLCDFRQAVFAFGDSAPSSLNQCLNLEKVGKCLQGSGKYRGGMQLLQVRRWGVVTITADGNGYPWQKKKLLLVSRWLLCGKEDSVWPHFQFSQKM